MADSGVVVEEKAAGWTIDKRRTPSPETVAKRAEAVRKYWADYRRRRRNVKETVKANEEIAQKRIQKALNAKEIAYLESVQRKAKHPEGEEMTPDQYESLGMFDTITPLQKRYVELRTQGFTPHRAVRAIDLEDNVQRSVMARRKAAESLEEATKLHQLAVLGTQTMTEAKFQAWKRSQLERLVSHPVQNGGVILAAMKKLEEQRELARFGTKEALEKTLAECKERYEELLKIREWGAKHVEALRVEGEQAEVAESIRKTTGGSG